MSVQTGWTPASRPGIVPLHPLSFGTILGRAFAALRQNPRVLLGFALVVQTAAYLVTIVAIGAVSVWAFSRLDTVPYASEDWNTILLGSFLIVGVAGLVLGVPAAAVVVVVQGVVVAEVAAEVVAERLTLGQVWRRVRPAVWRLLGWSVLVALAVLAVLAVAVVALIAIGAIAPVAAVVLALVLALGALPLTVWLSTKLLLVPSVLILERATLRDAVRRSWHLTRGRFWVAFGTVFVVAAIFGVIAQVVSLPLGLGASFLTSILAPTGGSDVEEFLGIVLTSVGLQIVVLLVQSVGAIVQSTATALVYVDCRMRHEGLDLDLQTYVERRDAGATDLPDPYLQHIGREIAPRTQPAYGGYPTQGYGAAGYPAQGYPAQAYPARYPTQGYAAAGYPAQGYPAAGSPTQGYPPYAQSSVPPYATAASTVPPYAQSSAPPYAAAAPPVPPYGAAPPVPPYAAPVQTAAVQPAPVQPAPPVPPRPAVPTATTWTAPGGDAGPDPETPWR